MDESDNIRLIAMRRLENRDLDDAIDALLFAPAIDQLPGKIHEAAEIAARGDVGDDEAHDWERGVAYALLARM